MANSERISGLMAELGPILELRGILEINDMDRWVLDLDGEHAVVVEYRPSDDRLFFTGEIGIPVPEVRTVIYELLLAYNAMWRNTGGIRMAVNGEDGAVIQIADIAATDLDVPALGTVVENFIGKMVEWTDIIATGPEGSAGDQASPGDVPSMRV